MTKADEARLTEFGTRLPEGLVNELHRIRLERKITRRSPWTIQGIMAEAIELFVSHERRHPRR